MAFLRAKEGAQTLDPQLGRLMLYQLSYFRKLSCGERRIRTSEVVRQLSYSQSHLATLVSPRDFYYVILIYSPYRFKERFEPVGGFEPATR